MLHFSVIGYLITHPLAEVPSPSPSHTHCGGFGSRWTGTGGRSFVPVQIQPDFGLSHLLEEMSTYFLKIHAAQKETCVSVCAGLRRLLRVYTHFHYILDIYPSIQYTGFTTDKPPTQNPASVTTATVYFHPSTDSDLIFF